MSEAATRGAPRAASPLLAFSETVCRYGARGSARDVVHGVAGEVADGEIVAIVGESGSGKSTLLRSLAGIQPDVSGRLAYRGEPLPWRVGERPRAARRGIQIVFQHPRSSLNPRHSIRRALTRPLDVYGDRRDATGRRRHVDELLEAVQLDRGLADRYPGELSGGQLQRVALARALVADPAVVLCDEIVSSLDVSVQAAILNLVGDLRERLGVAFLFVSHDLAVVRAIADRVLVMADGRIVEGGPTDRVFETPHAAYTRALLAAARTSTDRVGPPAASLPAPASGSDR